MIDSEQSAREYVASISDDIAIDKLTKFVAALKAENQQQNLVSQESLKIVWQRHIADSAQLLQCVSRETVSWLDIGSGAGLPGLVIAIIRPNIQVKLTEPRRKRYEWLKQVISDLAVTNCQVLGKRIEAVDSFQTDVISARAFASLRKTLDIGKRFSTDQTRFVLPKGSSAEQELQQLPPNVRKLFHVEQSLTDGRAGIIIGSMPDRE